jgi:NAD binding domain of 6-phosphogluconate dehydrogenase
VSKIATWRNTPNSPENYPVSDSFSPIALDPFMKIAVLGPGIIGSAWAKNLMADGHVVRCWNRTPKSFPSYYSSILDAIEGAEVIFVIVSDPPAGAVGPQADHARARPGRTVVQSSTISAAWTRALLPRCSKQERALLKRLSRGASLPLRIGKRSTTWAEMPSWWNECDRSSSRFPR